MFGQGGDDTVTTGSAADYVEGNDGDDTISAGGGNDDVLGGSSATNGQAYGGTGGRLVADIAGRTDATAARVLDGVDTIDGGEGDDTVLGDNGRITRPAADAPVPDVAMADITAGGTSGSDLLSGDKGDDVLYGQLDDGAAGAWGTGDQLEGGPGSDALLGDLAVTKLVPAADLGAPRTIASEQRRDPRGHLPVGHPRPGHLGPGGNRRDRRAGPGLR